MKENTEKNLSSLFYEGKYRKESKCRKYLKKPFK